MPTFYNPQIPTENISMLLDAENARSYSGSGNTWIDQVGNRNFEMAGSVLNLVTQDDAKCFQFDGTGFFECNQNTDGVDMGGDCTLLIWMYHEDNTERDTIFEKESVSGNQSYQDEIAVTMETNNRFTWYSRKTPNYDTASTAYDFSNNAWHLLGIKMSTGRFSDERRGFYSRNGAAWTYNYNPRSDTALLTAGNIRIGAGYAGAMENGKLAKVVTYNKMLNDAEVKAYYDATKGRYGLT